MTSTVRLIAIITAALIIVGCSAMAYQDEAMRYMQQTKTVLIEEGLCSDDKDCTRKEIAFWTAGGWKIGQHVGGGVSITVYGIPNPTIANKIIDRCRSLHSQIPNVPVSVTVYSSAHGASNKKIAHEKIY